MKVSKLLIILVLLTACSFGAPAQIVSTRGDYVSADSVRRDFKHQSYFGLYKDNYFIFGPSITRPNQYNTNVKFQLSISQRLTKAVLPYGTYLYLFYTQKCFWNVLEESMPMTDLNFNPGIGLSKPLFSKGRYIGKLTLMVEHESNGRDSIQSRSWNKVSLAGNIWIDKWLMVHAKAWIPIIDGQNNRDILHYCGIYQAGMQVMSANGRFTGSVTLTKRLGNILNFNTVIDLSYRIMKNDNQFIFLQYYNGYGEGLLDYKCFHNQIRAGIVIKPRFFSEY